jgi:hypothetical protein
VRADLTFLEAAWADRQVNAVTVGARAGKSTLVNYWLRRLAAKRYPPAELVFGWSFYRHGTRGDACSADEFLDAALGWFGDADPRLGMASDKGERLARLRRARLLAGQDPHHPGQLDAYPLVREYFGEQLHSQRTVAWQEGNRRRYR